MDIIRCATGSALLITLAACGGKEPPPAVVAETGIEAVAAETASLEITADLMRGYVRELSDDKYEGRGPGSPAPPPVRSP